MKNELAAISSWLKDNKLEITDEMIEGIHVIKNHIGITLLFTDENELAKFAMRVFPTASVIKVESDKDSVATYVIKFEYRKRAITAILRVTTNMPRAVDQIFSDERVANLNKTKY